MTKTLSVATAPKTTTFQMRINDEVKKNVEGLPLLAVADSKAAIKAQAKALLAVELEKGLESAEKEGWISEEEMQQTILSI